MVRNILKLLITQTNIHQTNEFCLCNEAIYYRLIDALKLILSSMNTVSINECFSLKSELTNNTASLARLILKLGYNNIKQSSIVWQNDIKQIYSQIDIENAKLNIDWFTAQNSENYTGYDYWILNHGINKQFSLLTDIKYCDCNFNKEILFIIGNNNSCYY